MPKIVSVQVRCFPVPLRAVRADAKHGEPTHFELFTATVPTPLPVLSSSHIETLLAAALAGLGIAGLPSLVVDQALRDGALERVLPQWCGLSLTLYAAVPTCQHMPVRTRAFVEFLVQTFGGKDGDPWLDAYRPRKTERGLQKGK